MFAFPPDFLDDVVVDLHAAYPDQAAVPGGNSFDFLLVWKCPVSIGKQHRLVTDVRFSR